MLKKYKFRMFHFLNFYPVAEVKDRPHTYFSLRERSTYGGRAAFTEALKTCCRTLIWSWC
jgi:hypothetical protein